MPSLEDYQLVNPDELITPCVLVYPKLIQANLDASVRIAGDVSRLRPHVKTHKTCEIVHMQLATGIHKFKCATLAEAQMLGECNAPDVLVAYPQIGPSIPRFAEIITKYPNTKFTAIADDLSSVKSLAKEMQKHSLELGVMVDIDTGMHRTGIPPGEGALALYQWIAGAPGLVAAGLHVYDGQNHLPDLSERQAAVNALMEPVLKLVAALDQAGCHVPRMVCGGTPTFPVFADLDLPDLDVEIEFSPGTCVFNDYNYGRDYPDVSGMQQAALVMTRVISKHHDGIVTLDLGNKAIASDPPAGARCHFLGLDDAREVGHNEEHLIVETTAADRLKVGDVLYVVPAHVCPTIALHSRLHTVENGELTGSWSVAARDRLY